MAESAFVVYVPEAEPYIKGIRERFDPVAKRRVPAHVTALYPFMSPRQITEDVLREVRLALATAVKFPFTLAKIGRFTYPEALYLTPEPAKPFDDLTAWLVGQFPEYVPYKGQYESTVPHLTVLKAGESALNFAEAELATTLPRSGIRASCNEVVLIENSSGRWENMHVFPLAPAK